MGLHKDMQGCVRFETSGHTSKPNLAAHLKSCGYHPVTFTLGLWKHYENYTTFTPVVDDFAIKYTSMEKVDHLLNVLKDK